MMLKSKMAKNLNASKGIGYVAERSVFCCRVLGAT